MSMLIPNLEELVAPDHEYQIDRRLVLYSGCAVVHPHVTSLRTVACETLDVFCKARRLPSFDLQFHSAGALEVVMDSSKVQEAVIELLNNSLEATHGSSTSVSVSVGYDLWSTQHSGLQQVLYDFGMPQGMVAYIEVSDKGCGMDPCVLERAFDPFFSTRFVGRGLGLSLVLGVARCHCSAVRAISIPGKGTSVRLLFPLYRSGKNASI